MDVLAVMTESVSQQVTVDGENGLHLVPCSLIAQCAGEFESELRISRGEFRVDARNIFDLMSLNAGQGTTLILEASGVDAAAAISRLVALFQSGFSGHAEPSEDES